jgi:polar amino acid transport system substrate-binding protein
MSITDERKQKVDFTDKYYQTPAAIVVPKDSEIKGITKEDLAGKSIGAQSSTTFANYAEAIYTDSDIKLYPTAEEYKLDIADGRLDAVNDDIVVLQQWLKTDQGACCKIAGTIAPQKQYFGEGIGIAIRKGENELREKFNAAIKAIRANGKYKEINDKYFDFDAYGGESS